MKNEPKLIKMKANDPKDQGEIDCYDSGILVQSSINRLKNRVEIEVCAPLVKPTKVLGIGGGSIRVALALAQKGFDVTLIDRSEAILEECANLAVRGNINLQLAELTDLPFSDAQFDTVLGFNVHIDSLLLEPILKEWKRITKPDGRIIFDIFSKDHFCITENLSETYSEFKSNNARTDPSNCLLASDEIVGLADRLGFTVAKVSPYGVLVNCYQNDWLPMALKQKRWWNRFLSLMKEDDSFLEGILFLEKEVVGIFPPLIAPYVLIAFDNGFSPHHNHHWLVQQMKFIEQARDRLDFDLLKNTCPSVDENWRAKLNAQLKPLRNRVFFYTLLTEASRLLPFLHLEGFIDKALLAQFKQWREQDEIDRSVMEFVENWDIKNPSISSFVYSDVPIARTLEYALAGQLISELSKKL